MTPKTPNEKLNFVLDQIRHERTYNELYREIEEHANMKGQFGNGEINLIMDKLRKDGYIDFVAGQKIATDFRASDGLNIRRSFEGSVFLDVGGYTQQSVNEKIDRRFRNVTTISLIFGGVAAGIYYTVELGKWIWASCFSS